MARRTPSGVRGLKFWAVAFAIVAGSGRTPSGVRGLKFTKARNNKCVKVVAPRQGCVD